MTIRNVVDVGDVAGAALLVAATVMPASTLADAVRYAGLGCITAPLILRTRMGYVRRRPHWTAQSWRRFLLVCSIPITALLMLVAMLFALEWRLPIVGARQSMTRSIWATASVVFMLVGAGGLAIAISWFADGEPSGQLQWPKWLARVRQVRISSRKV